MEHASAQRQKTTTNKNTIFVFSLLVLGVLILLSMILSTSLGQVQIPAALTYKILFFKLTGVALGDISEITAGSLQYIVWDIRLPRVLTALLVGAGLAMCGTMMQAAVKNPLADPYILGVSSGASLGATFAILIGFGAAGLLSQISVAFGAFSGAFAASLAVLALAELSGKSTSTKLVLSGMVVNALCNAFANFIIFFANDSEGIKSVTFWTMGSLAAAKWEKLPVLLIIILAASLFALSQSRILNTMLMGDEAAVTLGVNLTVYRRVYMVISSLITGVVVSYCGMIGFVGLIIPHIVRGFLGSDHRRLMPVAILTGSLFLIWADLIARIILPKTEIPIGIITAMAGAPVFIYMLIKRGYRFGKE
ncbi:iron complex transport system permease protein [Desulfitobacterium sp. LBE]|uniref:FecCD family ABC transporter permease n=1 Tax=Desulfitobacterium sp. LBE TaxID=884086 RepID=UPI0011996639|nr:iron ABC transporter permease [Desulfitobacterium sp. LBE]TWH57134.1 iron complex transport system permease protein [Desulfitobacterium sp. LBE]